jgi:hypothetical protein
MAIKPPIAALQKKRKRLCRKDCDFTNWAFGGLNAQFVTVPLKVA